MSATATRLAAVHNVTATTCRLAIGDGEVTLHLYRTTAPERYDGFGTVTLTTYDDERYVLIPEVALEWQLSRYGSGLYPVTPDDGYDRADIATRLSERIRNPNPDA